MGCCSQIRSFGRAYISTDRAVGAWLPRAGLVGLTPGERRYRSSRRSSRRIRPVRRLTWLTVPEIKASDYWRISRSVAIRAWWPKSGEAASTRRFCARARPPSSCGLDRCRRHSPDVARPGAVERLSAAPVGHRRLSGAVVRRLLVPSRSTVFGLYLHFGEDSHFWINLGIQALATLWILQLTLRVFGMARPLRLLAMSLVLILTTALPWLASMLLTDIFAGLSVLSLFILVAARRAGFPTIEKCSLFAFTAFAAATHSATLARAARTVLRRLDRASLSARADCRFRTGAGQPDHRRRRCSCCCRPISRCRDNWPGRPAVTASRSGGCCRMASSRAICSDHCPQQKFKLCPYRDQLPATADRVPVGQTACSTSSAAFRA